jgi:hypothetical protein
VVVEGAGHDLGYGRKQTGNELPGRIREVFTTLVADTPVPAAQRV